MVTAQDGTGKCGGVVLVMGEALQWWAKEFGLSSLQVMGSHRVFLGEVIPVW